MIPLTGPVSFRLINGSSPSDLAAIRIKSKYLAFRPEQTAPEHLITGYRLSHQPLNPMGCCICCSRVFVFLLNLVMVVSSFLDPIMAHTKER